jgi:hypothetical protein
MATPRERLGELLGTLSDDQIETVLGFAEALRQGRAVVSVCDVPGTDVETIHPPDGLSKDTHG